jgi:hypothetical protein
VTVQVQCGRMCERQCSKRQVSESVDDVAATVETAKTFISHSPCHMVKQIFLFYKNGG